MKNLKLLLWILTLIVLAALSFSLYKFSKTKIPPPPETMGEIFFLNETEASSLKRRALEENDPISAMLLARYYGGYVKDPIEARKWANIVLKAEGKQPLGENQQ